MADEAADVNSGWLEPRMEAAEQKQVYTEILARLRAEKDSK